MVTIGDVLVAGFLLGLGVWQVIDIIHDVLQLGQERHKDQRGTRTGGSGCER
jgi:hypothetical protein